MKRKNFFSSCVLLLFLGIATINVYAQPDKEKTASDPALISELQHAIEKNPADLELHDKYLKATGFAKWGVEEDPTFVKQYEEWLKKFPNSAAIPYALGHAYASKESPKAKPFLLKAVAIDPNFDKAYFDLWLDGERWGDFKVSREYLAKAKDAAPSNPDYAFYYANGFDDTDFEKYRKLSLEVAKNFPTSERGAQALYWLANKTKDADLKIKYYEQQKKDFPVEKFRWTSSGMSDYFNLLLQQSPQEALRLATELAAVKADERTVKSWQANTVLAKNIVEAQSLLAKGKGAEASAIMDSVTIPRWGTAKEYILLLKSKALDASGNTKQAYNNLLLSYASEPTAELKKEVSAYGNKLGKNADVIYKDIRYIRDTAAKKAPVFNMETYLTKGKSSLNDYKGKVVLITYWFPGCGPCRGEFPHFENVVKKFKGQDFVYLGINIVDEQDDYVVPFMKSSGYSFIPLKDNKDWVKGPLDNRNAAPVNFLIDQDGKIIFSRFRTDGSNEATLEMMIQSLLDRKKSI